MEPLRVAHVIGNMGNGGVEAVVMNYYRNIDRNKVQFDFIVDNDSTLPQREEIESLGGRIFIVPPYSKLIEYRKELKKILEENKYQIIHSHINTLSIFPLQVAKEIGIPVRIAHNHSTAGKGEFKRNIIKYTLRPFAKIYPTHYFACSEYAGRWLFGNKTFNQEKVTVINNAIDMTKFRFNNEIREEVRKELKLEDKIVIGHVGRFVNQKNHLGLINIFNEIYKKEQNSILILIGEGPLEEEVKNRVKELNLSEAVKFLGVRKDVNRLMQGMDIFLLPSFYEGLPVVGVEAQASGLLCILSDDMTKETKILDRTVFLSLNQSPEEWANVILEMQKEYERKDSYTEFRDKCFEIEEEARKLEKKYI